MKLPRSQRRYSKPRSLRRNYLALTFWCTTGDTMPDLSWKVEHPGYGLLHKIIYRRNRCYSLGVGNCARYRWKRPADPQLTEKRGFVGKSRWFRPLLETSVRERVCKWWCQLSWRRNSVSCLTPRGRRRRHVVAVKTVRVFRLPGLSFSRNWFSHEVSYR